MKIRGMKISDYESIYKLWLDTPGMGLNSIDDSKDGIEKYLARNPSTSFVAETDGGEIIGVILCGNDGRRGYIHHTAVRASEQSRGIGTALVDAALDALRHEGITKAALLVFDSNEAGNAFWEKRGFPPRKDLVYRNRSL